jgi:iron complex transport system substrate-binding protein
MNLCTDQLAMLIAAPGQLLSVSYLAAEPRMSPMADAARAYRTNRGQSEDLFLMHPDLVLADEWSDPAAVAMLRRLGVRVEQFPPGQSIGEIRGNISRMGDLLGQSARAAQVLADFDRAMAAIPPPAASRPRAALYGPNGWTDGPASLAGQILDAAGYANVAGPLGIGFGGTLPLETLVMADPDLVITGSREDGAARAEEPLSHPALRPFLSDTALTDAAWVCAGPFTPAAIRALALHRLGGGPDGGGP